LEPRDLIRPPLCTVIIILHPAQHKNQMTFVSQVSLSKRLSHAKDFVNNLASLQYHSTKIPIPFDALPPRQPSHSQTKLSLSLLRRWRCFYHTRHDVLISDRAIMLCLWCRRCSLSLLPWIRIICVLLAIEIRLRLIPLWYHPSCICQRKFGDRLLPRLRERAAEVVLPR